MKVMATVGVAVVPPLQPALASHVGVGGVVAAHSRQLVAVAARFLARVPALPPNGVEEGLKGARPVAVDLEGAVVELGASLVRPVAGVVWVGKVALLSARAAVRCCCTWGCGSCCSRSGSCSGC